MEEKKEQADGAFGFSFFDSMDRPLEYEVGACGIEVGVLYRLPHAWGKSGKAINRPTAA